MISKEKLIEISRATGLPLYQQEKDYLLKLFLFYYYKKFGGAIFKGGTCIKYLFGLNRFSEDLDFNIKNPKVFQLQVRKTLKEMGFIGIDFEMKKEELFNEAYTAEMGFQGPLYDGRKFTQNKFRVDAGKRIGTLMKPEWNLISSEYPETSKNFLVLSMHEEEILAEKILAMLERKKGRDLFDAWFLVKKGVKFNKKMFQKKARQAGKKIRIDFKKIVSEEEYERDMKKLTGKVIPYEQVKREIKAFLKEKIKQ